MNLPLLGNLMRILVRRIKNLQRQPRRFLVNSDKIKDIEPLPKTLCSELGIGAIANGGVPQYGSLAYIIWENKSTGEKTSKIACSKSKVSKRTIPANEALSRILQMDITKSIARVIQRRPEIVGTELTILLAFKECDHNREATLPRDSGDAPKFKHPVTMDRFRRKLS